MKLLDRLLIFGSLCTVFMLGSTISKALDQQRGIYTNAEDVFVEMQNIYTKAQSKQFTLFTSTPSVRDLDERNIVVVRNGNLRSIFFKESGALYYIQATEY